MGLLANKYKGWCCCQNQAFLWPDKTKVLQKQGHGVVKQDHGVLNQRLGDNGSKLQMQESPDWPILARGKSV